MKPVYIANPKLSPRDKIYYAKANKERRRLKAVRRSLNKKLAGVLRYLADSLEKHEFFFF